jgi:uncharacterized protein involved in response to NO
MNQPLSPPVQIAEKPQAPAALRGWPLLRLGFRPFYLGAALLACLSVPWWIGVFLGHVPQDLGFSPLLWHGHEMLFGFAAGVIVGFLLTAVRAWTGLPTPRGPLLGFLALLWLAARLAAFVAPYWLYALLDVLLLPIVAVLLLRVLIAARNKRNLPLISLLLAMAVANAVFHLSLLEIIHVPALSALYAELALILMVVSVMTGRVVPLFTKNVTPGLVISVPPRFEPWLLGTTGLALACWVFGAPAMLTLVACLAAAGMHVVRLWRWQPRVTLDRPILWILHLSCAWFPIGFLLLAMAQLGWVTTSLAVHALGVGVIGGLIIGMMTRTARGHLGRPLKASGAEALAYAMVLVAAVVRALVPAVLPDWYVPALGLAAGLWGLAFLIYVVVYAPWLLRTRLDGKDG